MISTYYFPIYSHTINTHFLSHLMSYVCFIIMIIHFNGGLFGLEVTKHMIVRKLRRNGFHFHMDLTPHFWMMMLTRDPASVQRPALIKYAIVKRLGRISQIWSIMFILWAMEVQLYMYALAWMWYHRAWSKLIGPLWG